MERDVGGEPARGPGLLAQNLVIALGAWLLASLFVWTHTSSDAFNDLGCGILIALIGALAVYMPRARFLNTGMAVWLAYWAVTFEHRGIASPLNDALVALAVFALSLAPAGAPLGVPEPAAA